MTGLWQKHEGRLVLIDNGHLHVFIMTFLRPGSGRSRFNILKLVLVACIRVLQPVSKGLSCVRWHKMTEVWQIYEGRLYFVLIFSVLKLPYYSPHEIYGYFINSLKDFFTTHRVVLCSTN